MKVRDIIKEARIAPLIVIRSHGEAWTARQLLAGGHLDIPVEGGPWDSEASVKAYIQAKWPGVEMVVDNSAY